MPIAHTARFLQTFHTGQTAAQRTEESQTATPTDHRDVDPSAVAFVRGVRPTAAYQPKKQAAAPAGAEEFVHIKAYRVKVGPGLVTEKQASWMISIAERPSVTEAMRASLQSRLEQGFARSAASDFITKYKDIPTAAAHTTMVEAVAPGASEEEFRAAQRPVTRPHVADGRYAVEEDGELKFFKVKNGRKAGFVFLDIQASDDWHSIRNPRRIDAILALIAEAGEVNAMRRYGIEIGSCGRCGRTLTSEYRHLGIGPVCIDK